MSCLVSNVYLCQSFSHAQLDSQSIEYFNVIRAQRWLGMKKGVWRSGGPPQFFDLPCFHQHLYLYLNTLFCLSLQPVLKENTHRLCQRLESDHEVRRRMNEIVWHWNDNSLRFFFSFFWKRELGVFILMCPFCTFMTRVSTLGIFFNQLSSVSTEQEERTLTENSFPAGYMV